MHYYTRHIGDYAKDTGHLSLLEHGVYTVLLDWCYATEKALPDDLESVYRICRAQISAEKKAVQRVVEEFFPASESGRKNKRAVLEINEFRRKSEKNGKAAALRWQCERNANAQQTQSDGNTTRARVPLTNTQEPISNNHAVEQAAVIPSEQEVLAEAKKYPGDMSRGIPAEIPEGWALNWLAWRMNPSAGPFPTDWISDMHRRFRAGWINGDPRTGRKNEKTGATTTGVPSANVVAIERQKKTAALRQELRELEQEIEALVAAGAEVPREKTLREREIRKEISE